MAQINDTKPEWESEDKNLYLRWQVPSEKTILFATGRVNTCVHLSSMSISDLGTSWFLICGDTEMELLTRAEMVEVAEFLGLTPITEF